MFHDPAGGPRPHDVVGAGVHLAGLGDVMLEDQITREVEIKTVNGQFRRRGANRENHFPAVAVAD